MNQEMKNSESSKQGLSESLKKDLSEIAEKKVEAKTRVVRLVYTAGCGCGPGTDTEVEIERDVPMDSTLQNGDRAQDLGAYDRIVS